MSIGWIQILIVVALLVLLFGGKRIPALMSDIATGITNFRKGLRDSDNKPDADKD